MTPFPKDNSIREHVLDVAKSYHVEAPAGSGKTTLLIRRYIRLLGIVNHPHEMLALTFTNKAAGEMKERIWSIFNKAGKGKGPPGNPLKDALVEDACRALKRHEKWKDLLLSPDGLQVMTFHGFCYSLISKAPFEAGISPGSDIMSEDEQELLLGESIRRSIRDIWKLPRNAAVRVSLENRLLRLNNRMPALIQELKRLIKERDLFKDLVSVVRFHRDLSGLTSALSKRLESLAESFLKEAAEQFEAVPLAGEWEGFKADLRAHGASNSDRLPEHFPAPTMSNLGNWKALADVLTTKQGKMRQKTGPSTGFYNGFSGSYWGGKVREIPDEAASALHNLKDLPEPGMAPTDIAALADLVILFAHIAGDYAEVCRKNKMVDFVELEEGALSILNEDPPTDLQLFLDHRINHILVDEFQDTSRNQWLLLRRLCAGWDHGDGRTIFFVGDPKQSIYAFRKAEVSLFEEAKKGMPLPGRGRLLMHHSILSSNFRSDPLLIEWVNELFGQTVMANPAVAYDEVPFHPSVYSGRHDHIPVEQPVSLNLFRDDKNGGLPTETEAAWLANTVARTEAETEPDTSIAILLFTRNRLPYYLNALTQAGVSVRVKEGIKIAEYQEIKSLRQIAVALCRPHDDIAWAALLRSPWLWMDADVLLEVGRESPVDWRSKIVDAAQSHPEINRLLDAVRSARRRIGRDPLWKVTSSVWMELDGPEKVAACFGTGGVENCRRFLEILESVEQGMPEETLAKLDIALERLYAPDRPQSAECRVDLMTVHAAKGLEFDIVFLPFLDWRPLARAGPSPPYLLERLPDKDRHPLIAMGPDRRSAEPEPAYRLLKELQEKREIGEAKRLFYVGVTRAKRRIFMSGIVQLTGERIVAQKRSILSWVMDHEQLAGASLDKVTSHQNRLMRVRCNPVIEKEQMSASIPLPPLPEPISFHPEPIPYLVESPSSLANEDFARSAEDEFYSGDAEFAAARGTITHRIIESFWRARILPDIEQVASALENEGVDSETALFVGKEILHEISLCLEESFFNKLMHTGHSVAYSEWSIEDFSSPDKIRSGTLDFVFRDGSQYLIVDFKTSKPEAGETIETFLMRQSDSYRPQLTAYREMLSRVKECSSDRITVGLYFTRLQRWSPI